MFKPLKSAKGQGTVEYLLIIAVMVGVIFLLKGRIQSGLQNLSDTVFQGSKSKAQSLMQ